jgi:hypothetical protein
MWGCQLRCSVARIVDVNLTAMQQTRTEDHQANHNGPGHLRPRGAIADTPPHCAKTHEDDAGHEQRERVRLRNGSAEA